MPVLIPLLCLYIEQFQIYEHHINFKHILNLIFFILQADPKIINLIRSISPLAQK